MFGVSKTCRSGRTDPFTTGQPRPLLRFHVATSLSCPTMAIDLSIPSAVPEDLERMPITGAGNGALTRPSEGREGKDKLVPPIPGTELGTESVCSTGWRLMVQRRKEREPSAGLNIKMSWKSARLRRCGGERGSRDGDD